jgi:hypothetical protein
VARGVKASIRASERDATIAHHRKSFNMNIFENSGSA